MLFFRQRSDVVFCDILREALAWIAEDLKANETDPHVMSTLLPRVAPVLSFETALATVGELRMALDSAQAIEVLVARPTSTLMKGRFCRQFT